MKHVSQLRNAALLLAFAALAACGPAPTTPQPTATPSASASATPFPEPSSAPTASPSAEPTAAPTAEPSASATSMPSPMPSGTPAASAAPSASPSAAPSDGPLPTPSPSAASPETLALRDNFFKNYGINPFVEAATDSLSTFAADVDTASYTITRSYLNTNRLPDTDAVRTEEFLNYFNYHYPQPVSGKFAIHTDLIPSYFGDAETKLLRVGIQGQEVLDRNRKDLVLTFVIDVSGSMNQENRLGLVKQSLRLLLDKLRSSDRVGLVIYGTSARTVLPHTSVANKALILSAIENLRPEGSTNVADGLVTGYAQANSAFVEGAVNRVILCSDGVANVGATGPEEILPTIRAQRDRGINLTTLGFGLAGYNDVLMEQLANQGDGNYAYIDTLDEARKVLDEQLTSTLQTIAKDVKIQVAFDPAFVDQYRLLGYENRNIADDDFRDDTVDAGEVGSGHSVTALYEVRFKPGVANGSFANVQLRYKDVDDADAVREISRMVNTSESRAFSEASGSLRLAVAVSGMAEILRDSIFAQGSRMSDVLSLAQTAQAAYPDDARIQEFVSLATKASALKQPSTIQSFDKIFDESIKPAQTSEWENFLLKQLGGKASK